MPRNPNPDISIIPSPRFDFSGGINTTMDYEDMADNEARDIINFRYNEEDTLVTRPGVTIKVRQIASANITNSVTSVFGCAIREIFVSNNKIYTTNSATAPTDITGAASMPVTNPAPYTGWQWCVFSNLIIGVPYEGGIAIKIASVGNAANLGGTPPTGAICCTVWNNRVWLGGAGGRNTLAASALGNAEDWTTTGAAGKFSVDIDPTDDDFITGLYVFRERLFVFKTKSIYTIQAISGAAATDVTALSVEQYTKNIGCISPYSIQAVLDDVVYASFHGVASLVASDQVGDFNTALLSRKVKSLYDLFPKGTSSNNIVPLASVVIPEHSQYVLFLPQAEVTTPFAEQYQNMALVMDYQKIQQGIIRWSRYWGAITGSCISEAQSKGSYLIGGRTVNNTAQYQVVLFSPNSDPNYTDASANTFVAIVKRIITKSYTIALPFNRKEWHRVGYSFLALDDNITNDPAVVSVDYYLDDLEASAAGSLSFTIQLGSDNRRKSKIKRKLKYNTKGRRSTAITFKISNTNDKQGFGVDGINIWFSVLPEKRGSYA